MRVGSGSSVPESTARTEGYLVDRDSPVSSDSGTRLRDRVRQELLARIAAGEWRPGERVAPEAELARDLGVSRPTLREALEGLQDNGYLRRIRGQGTFITYRRNLRNNLDRNCGVSELIRSMGSTPGTEDLRVYMVLADDSEADQLSVPPGTPLQVVERVRTADGRPVVLSRDLLPASILPREVTEAVERIGQGSLYRLLESFGLPIGHGVASISPLLSDREISARLRIPKSTLLVYLLQVDFDRSGRPILLSHEHLVADAFEFNIYRSGQG